MLSIRNLSKTFPDGTAALRPTDLEVAAGERFVLLGPSGSGKSTLLRLIVGLDEPTTGEVWRDGERIDRLPPHKRGVAYLPQRPALYPHLTVRENLEASGQWRMDKGKTQARASHDSSIVHSPLSILHCDALLHRFPHQLSGGEKQRVVLAKLLLRGCPVWLLDEPFSGLDPVFRDEFRHDLHLLSARANATIIIVSHDPFDASALGRRLGVLGDGVLQQVGTPDELRTRPSNRFVAFALGRFCFLDGTVGDAGAEFATEGGTLRVPLPAELAGKLPPSGRVTLGLRPDDLVPAEPGSEGAAFGRWPVISTEPAGGGWILMLARGRTRVQAEWRTGPPPTPDAITEWTLPAGRGLWFDTDTGRCLS